VRLEGLGQLKRNSMTSSGLEPTTFRLGTEQYLSDLKLDSPELLKSTIFRDVRPCSTVEFH
jgi:hypothetical protein